jgi:thiol-disulfide isomerase/thioredoxin
VLQELIKMNGRKETIDFSSQKELTLIQIMGTWCPNCLDETKLLQALHAEYGSKGLHVVALAFEVGTDTKKQRMRLKQWIKSMKVNYPVYLAGTSSKDAASARFPMLNGIMSFPTSILVDQQGKIIAIHTGFSGPATGEAYTELVDKYRQEIERALE